MGKFVVAAKRDYLWSSQTMEASQAELREGFDWVEIQRISSSRTTVAKLVAIKATDRRPPTRCIHVPAAVEGHERLGPGA